MIRYTDERSYTKEQLERLFLSVDWESGKHPDRLYRAIQNCETVFTAWDGEELVGLISAIDDGEIAAYVHFLLVAPDHQGSGIGKALLKLTEKKYKDFLHYFLVAEHKGLIEYYERLGFKHASESSLMVYKEHFNE